MVRLNSIQHIGIPVTDIRISEEFYKRLGFGNVMESTFLSNDDKGIAVMMKYDAMIIELYQMPEEELNAIRSRKDGHVDHVAFDVTDIDETFRQLQSESFHVIEHEPVFLNFWKKGCRYFNILGPDGERLEFNQIL